MMTALMLLRDEMEGEACHECRDLRKGFNAAARLQKFSPKGVGKKYALPVLLRSLYSYSMQPSRSALAERIFGSNAVHQRHIQRFPNRPIPHD